MSGRRRAVRSMAGLLAGVLLAASLGAVPASAGSTAGPCGLGLGSVTAGGDHRFQGVKAGTPPTAGTGVVGPKDLYPAGAVRLATSVGFEPVVPGGVQRAGLVVIGPRLYASGYQTDGSGTELAEPADLSLVGGGWTQYHRYLERSTYSEKGWARQNVYTLVDDVIARWTVGKDGWRYYTTFAGFGSVKTMALISQTRTYDTFLATTNGGALYTIRVSTGAAAPVVKKVRASTWQAFDTLIAEKCGRQGTLLLGIDKDTRTGYLYAVGHGNGAATVIQGLGKVQSTFTESNYFRYFLDTPEAGYLFGE